MADKTSSIVPQFPWEIAYEVAYTEVSLETDKARLAELISVAQRRLLLRLLELAASPEGNEREVQTLEHALGSLAILKQKRESSSS